MGRFNSRSRVGSDAEYVSAEIVIAAFQFALPRGERPISTLSMAATCSFQFALPRGERLATPVISGHQGRFNSRSRVGSDMMYDNSLSASIVSIRAPAWGATQQAAL